VLSQLTSFFSKKQLWKASSASRDRYLLGFEHQEFVLTHLNKANNKSLDANNKSNPFAICFDATVGVTFALNGLESLSDKGVDTLANTVVNQNLGLRGNTFEVRWSRLTKELTLVTAIRTETFRKLNAWIQANGYNVVEMRPVVVLAIEKAIIQKMTSGTLDRFILHTANTMEGFSIETTPTRLVTVFAPVISKGEIASSTDLSYVFSRGEDLARSSDKFEYKNLQVAKLWV
jgi:hypothetical protein